MRLLAKHNVLYDTQIAYRQCKIRIHFYFHWSCTCRRYCSVYIWHLVTLPKGL